MERGVSGVSNEMSPMSLWSSAPVCMNKSCRGKEGVTLPAKSALAIAYMRTNLTPFPKPTAYAHFVIISSWPSWPGLASQSVYMEKRYPRYEGNPTIANERPSKAVILLTKPTFCLSFKLFPSFARKWMVLKVGSALRVVWEDERPF